MWDLVDDLPHIEEERTARKRVDEVMAMPYAQKAFVQAVANSK